MPLLRRREGASTRWSPSWNGSSRCSRPYRSSSEISRINRGELDVARSSPEVRDVLVACAWLERDSGGVFCIHPPESPDIIDPSGYVKGWATERAAPCCRRPACTTGVSTSAAIS
jgi:thiamine biosynthesis lipoprotein